MLDKQSELYIGNSLLAEVAAQMDGPFLGTDAFTCTSTHSYRIKKYVILKLGNFSLIRDLSSKFKLNVI